MTAALFPSWSAEHIARVCGGEVLGEASRRPTGIANDSRRLLPGDLFVALRAERDGHQFIDAAREAGAGVLLVERDRRPEPRVGEAVVAVADTFVALQDLGRALFEAHRQRRSDRVAFGITGSNGKTTTKELAAALLEAAYPGEVLRTLGNLNNHIGLPMTLCRLSEAHRFVVLEMGASVPGDIALLTRLAPVERAAVTSLAAAHLEGLGDLAAVAAEKGSILRGHPPARVGVVPVEQRAALTQRVVGQVRTFGEEATADVQVTQYEAGDPSMVSLRVAASLTGGEDDELSVGLGLIGRHNARNLAAAVALTFDLLPEDSRGALVDQVARAAQPVAGRLSWRRARRGAVLLDDSYNANPGSLAAALAVLSERPGRRWLILGDMLELGEGAEAAHRAAGRAAASAGCERVWAVGEYAAAVVAGATLGGAGETAVFEAAPSCAEAARSVVQFEDVVLVKGSRGVQLDLVAAALAEEVN